MTLSQGFVRPAIDGSEQSRYAALAQLVGSFLVAQRPPPAAIARPADERVGPDKRTQKARPLEHAGR